MPAATEVHQVFSPCTKSRVSGWLFAERLQMRLQAALPWRAETNRNCAEDQQERCQGGKSRLLWEIVSVVLDRQASCNRGGHDRVTRVVAKAGEVRASARVLHKGMVIVFRRGYRGPPRSAAASDRSSRAPRRHERRPRRHGLRTSATPLRGSSARCRCVPARRPPTS